MRTFLGAVLSAIAVGVLLIAYGLLSPGTRAAGPLWSDGVADSRGNAAFGLRCEPGQRAVIRRTAGAEEAGCVDTLSADRYGSTLTPVAYRSNESLPVQTYERYPASRRTAPARAARPSSRDWKKTALVIGGSAASGAGVGAIIGGKKGALIGAAIGGGASSLIEAVRR